MDDLGDFYSSTVRVLLTGVSHEIFAQSISMFAEQNHVEGSNEMKIILVDNDPVYLIQKTYDLSPANKEARQIEEQHDIGSNQMDIGDQDGLGETHVNRQVNAALITYDLSIENSFTTGLEIAEHLKRTICPGCITLIGLTSNPAIPRNVSVEEISMMCKSINIKFEEISSLNLTVVKNAFREFVESSCHINVIKWFGAAEKHLLYEDFLHLGRCTIYEMFIGAPNWKSLVQQIHNDVKLLTKHHCLRLSNEPVIDFIHILFRKTHRSVVGNKYFPVKDSEITREKYKLKDYFPRVKDYIPKYTPESISNFQPTIFTTITTYDTEAVKKLSFKHPDVRDADCLEMKSSDSNESSSYYYERQACYKRFKCGDSWKSWSALQPEPDVPKNDGSIQEEMNDSTQEESDNLTANGVNFLTPTVNPRKRDSRGMSAGDKPSSLSAKNSVKSLSSNDSASARETNIASKTEEMIPAQVMKTFNVKGDRLIVDIIIFCPNLEICRYLSATFGLIFVDEILLHLCNIVGAKETPPRYMHFQNSQVEGFIKNEWDQRLKPAVNYKKSFRFIQTRYAEYLNDGHHNIALTTYQGLIKNVTASTYAAMIDPKQRIEDLGDFSCVMQLPLVSNELPTCKTSSSFKAALLPKPPLVTQADQFMSAISALSRIVDRALKYSASVPTSLRFKKKFYEVNLSLISVIPLYVLKFLSEERSQQADQELMKKRLNDCEPLL